MEKDRGEKESALREQRQVFVIRMWPEPRELEGEPPQLRGVIEHVSSGQKRYFLKIEDITQFIAPYVEQMGVERA